MAALANTVAGFGTSAAKHRGQSRNEGWDVPRAHHCQKEGSYLHEEKRTNDEKKRWNRDKRRHMVLLL